MMFSRFRLTSAAVPALFLAGLMAASTTLAAQDSPAEHPETLAPGAAAPHSGAPTDIPDTAAARARRLDGFYERLGKVSSADVALPLVLQIENLTATSGSATADLLLARANAALEQGDHPLAMRFLDAALELQPDFAEAWNRRAFVFYQENEMQRALGDLRRALALEPRHLRALGGLAGILRGLGEKKAALAAFKKLLDVNPFAEGAADAVKELTVEVEGQGI